MTMYVAGDEMGLGPEPCTFYQVTVLRTYLPGQLYGVRCMLRSSANTTNPAPREGHDAGLQSSGKIGGCRMLTV